MIRLRPLLGRGGTARIVGLLQCGYAAHGLATITLVAAFLILPMPARTFARQFAILLFIIGSVMIVDGAIGIRTRIDHVADRLRTGRAALVAATLRFSGGTIAMMLCIYGPTAI
ncbi:hypothetical protein FHS96_005618 [Sphingomonas zeicaulis]|uniref:hypothetical protein n=1 Tax=Sphingomonas zeicaulis TaxID=1632740 RepID=UPI003D212BDC